jgi:hypothetical protein
LSGEDQVGIAALDDLDKRASIRNSADAIYIMGEMEKVMFIMSIISPNALRWRVWKSNNLVVD